MKWMVLALLAAPVVAQTQNEKIRLAMQSSLARQRASVVKQAQAAGAGRVASDIPIAAPRVQLARQAIPIPCPPLAGAELDGMIGQAARENAVEPDVIREVARQESAFRPCAVSVKGAEGLMQLMPATQAMLAVSDPFDPGQSLMAGARLLRQLLNRYGGDLSLALAAYNAGPGRVDPIMGIPPIPETKNYVTEILDRLGQ